MQVWTQNGNWWWGGEEEMFMFTASAVPAASLPSSFSLSCLFALLYILIHTEENTLASDALSLFSLSTAFHSCSCSFSPTPHKGQRDQQSMTLLIDAHLCRSFSAAVWTIARTCHWLGKDCHLTLERSERRHFVGFCSTSDRRNLSEAQKRLESRGITKHVEMLLGKTVECVSDLWERNKCFTSSWCFMICLKMCCFCGSISLKGCEHTPITVCFYNNDFTSLLKGRLGLLPPICPHSVPLHPKWVPGLFVFLIDPFWWSQVWSSDQYNSRRSQMCQVILSHTRTALISLCRLLAIMSLPPRGNMPRLARIIGAC